jgi:neutral ceramidase
MKPWVSAIVMVLVVCGRGGPSAQTRDSALRVGAARVDITPAQGELPKNSQGVLDRLYARAIVLESGSSTAALITIDAGAVSDAIWQAVTERLRTELAIPTVNVLLTATHTHSAGGPRAPDYVAKIVESVRQARQKLAPARVGYDTGVSYINVNRNVIDRKTNRWWEGPNYEGPSDKTVAVLAFESLSGQPIAVYYNYAVHGVITGQLDQVSGDIPGAASRYIEESLDGAVALARSPSGRPGPPATRTRSTTSRPTICARSASRITRRAVSTSAMPCRRAERASIGRTRRWRR